MIINQTLILDLLTALWVSILFVILFFWLPKKSFFKTSNIDWDQLVSCWSRTVFVTVIGVLALTGLGLFNWFTLVLLYVGYLLSGWIYRYRWRVKKQFNRACQRVVFAAADALDRGLSFQELSKAWERIWLSFSVNRGQFTKPQVVLSVLLLVAIALFALLLRFEHPLFQLRLGHPDSYSNLLMTRQILAGDWPSSSYVPVFSAIAAILSLLGSIEPMHVVRFLGPLLGFMLALSVGYGVRTFAGNVAALVAMYSLGAYLFIWHGSVSSPEWLQQLLANVSTSIEASLIRQWAGGNLEIGAIFLVLGLARLQSVFTAKRRRAAWIDTVCCLALVAITAPSLLLLALVGSVGLWVRQITLAIVGTAWLLLALVAAIPQAQFDLAQILITLPVGLSLLCGACFTFIAWLLRPGLGKLSEAVCLVIIFSISLNCLLPPAPNITYLEYEMAARKTLELGTLFPSKRWMLVAPVEQLAQSYGKAWYSDLALFVEQYSQKAGQADFQFPGSVPDLFIFVEKRPFATFATEPEIVPSSLLSDSTYRYYRSSAGRASLQFDALQMCEAYRRSHSDTSIYYEDLELRIYHFRL